MKLGRIWCGLATLVLVSLALAITARADMGQIHATKATVSEEDQKAIILQNLNEEILILGTDIRADQKTGLIRFIPFPAEPRVELASGDPFQAVMELVDKYRLVYVYQTKGEQTRTQGVEVTFNQKLGSHDVTVVKINDAQAFRQWVNDYFKARGLPVREAYPEIEAVAQDYVNRGLAWFVFDFVEADDQVRFVEPLMYRFASPSLYYPLKTSNTFGGEGGINLFVLAPRTACDPLAYYFPGCLDLLNLQASTSEKIAPTDAAKVFAQAEEFFKGQDIYLQSFTFLGQYQFDHDIMFDLGQGFDGAFPVDDFIKQNHNPFEELLPDKQ